MSDVKWIKVSIGIFDDEKIRYIEQLPEADTIFTIWMKFLVLAGKKNMGGEVYFNDEIPYTDEMLAAIFHRKVNTVRMALETFCKLRMIEISADRTIVISNWGKHQNVEGLDKIREQAAERARRHRAKQQSLNGRHVTRNVMGNVTGRDAVTLPLRDVTPTDNKTENKKERIEGNALSGVGEGQHKDTAVSTEADLVQHAEAKRILGKLCADKFPDERPGLIWPNDWEHWLDAALPIQRESLELIDWGYRQPDDHAIFKVTMKRHSFGAIVENLRSEASKFRAARKKIGLNGLLPVGSSESDTAMQDDWTSARKQAAFELYGESIRLTEHFAQMPASSQSEIDKKAMETASLAPANQR